MGKSLTGLLVSLLALGLVFQAKEVRADARTSELLSVWLSYEASEQLRKDSGRDRVADAVAEALAVFSSRKLTKVVRKLYHDGHSDLLFVRNGTLSESGRALCELANEVETHGVPEAPFALDALEGRIQEYRVARSLFVRPRVRWSPPDGWRPPAKAPFTKEEEDAREVARQATKRLVRAARTLDVHLAAVLVTYLAEGEGLKLSGAPLGRRVRALLRSWESDEAAAAALRGLFPAHEQYARLTVALGRYLLLWRSRQPDRLPERISLVPGERSGSVGLLRRRLAWEGILPAGGPALYDKSVEEAVRVFQKAHGLIPTGEVNGVTLRALRRPASWWVRKLMLALQRWRRSPARDNPGSYIRVNVPEYVTELRLDGVETLRMRSLVGKPSTRTRVLKSAVRKIRINPNWNIPSGVAKREIDPRAQEDPMFLEQQHIIRRGARYVQKAGPWNWMGRALLAFPNRYALALHGTLRTHLFDKEHRAYSNGCVNLEDELAFTRKLLEHDRNPALHKLETWLRGWKPRRVRLRRAIPLFIEYQTVVVNDEGLVRFLPDIYGHDGKGFQRISLERFRRDGHASEAF